MNPAADPDAADVQRVRAGGEERAAGIAALYRRHAAKLLGYFLRQRVARPDAADLVQEVFVNVVRHSAGFRGEAKFGTWLWSIARNALIDHLRRSRGVELDIDELALEAAAPGGEAGIGLQDCVRRAYAEFAAAYQDRAETLALVAFEGWSIGEVATYLGRTPGAAREYLSQCRKKLRPFLERCREFLLS